MSEIEKIDSKIGDLIKGRRKYLNMTQDALAKETGISQSLIAKVEMSELSPRFDYIIRIFKILGIEASFSIPEEIIEL